MPSYLDQLQELTALLLSGALTQEEFNARKQQLSFGEPNMPVDTPVAPVVAPPGIVPMAVPVDTPVAPVVAPPGIVPMAVPVGTPGAPVVAPPGIVPVNTVPLGAAVPFGAEVPVGMPMAMPVSIAAANAVAPTPMSMQAPASGFSRLTTLRFPCCAEKYEQLKAMTRADVPYALAARGMTRRQWTECTDAIERVHDAQFFKNCPTAECCYWCIPLGPLQSALCIMNPISCVFCIQPVERARRACITRCTPILRPLGYKVSVPDFDWEDAVIFEPGM